MGRFVSVYCWRGSLSVFRKLKNMAVFVSVYWKKVVIALPFLGPNIDEILLSHIVFILLTTSKTVSDSYGSIVYLGKKAES